MTTRLALIVFMLTLAAVVHFSSGDRGEKDESGQEVAQDSLPKRDLSMGLTSKGSMVTTATKNKTGAFPADLEGIPVRAMTRDEVLQFSLCPFNSCLTWKGTDVTGTTWSPMTLPATPQLGLFAEATQFAWINPGFHAGDGGFVFANEKGEIVGGNTVCDPGNATQTFKFCPPETIQALPPTFSVGRMVKITLDFLLRVGAKRFTWVHQDENIGFQLNKGGFLYLMEIADQEPSLVFFQMTSDKGCTTLSTHGWQTGAVPGHTGPIDVSVNIHVGK